MNPPSILTKKQVKARRVDYIENRKPVILIAHIRHDDECGNGHNTFSITADLYEGGYRQGEPSKVHENGQTLYLASGGCLHDEIAKHIPDLIPYLKWHLCSTDGPLHYTANTIYSAGDRDHHGLRKGEFRQHRSRGQQNGGVEGVPNWVLKFPEGMATDVYAYEKPQPVTLEWVPYGRTGEGKARELAHARSNAIWPDATDEQLMAEPDVLNAALLARLPALMLEFKQAVESLGFTY